MKGEHHYSECSLMRDQTFTDVRERRGLKTEVPRKFEFFNNAVLSILPSPVCGDGEGTIVM
jgi:hypothetical protein